MRTDLTPTATLTETDFIDFVDVTDGADAEGAEFWCSWSSRAASGRISLHGDCVHAATDGTTIVIPRDRLQVWELVRTRAGWSMLTMTGDENLQLSIPATFASVIARALQRWSAH